MADEGQIHYPYSTREVVNIVKHLEVRKTVIRLFLMLSLCHLLFLTLSSAAEVP